MTNVLRAPNAYRIPPASSAVAVIAQASTISLALLSGTPFPPFQNFDQPNPQIAGRLLPPVGSQGLALNYATFNPAVPVDQPNPRLPQYPAHEVGAPPPPRPPPPPLPFAQADWPNPRGYSYQSIYRPDPPRGPLGGDAQPFNLSDHPNPIRAHWAQTLYYPGRPLQPPPPAMGPHQTDWPNPRGYIPSISLKTHLDPLKLNLIGKDVFPIRPGAEPSFGFENPHIAGRELPPIGYHNINLNPAPLIPLTFGLIPTILNTGQLQLQLNTILQLLIDQLPSGGPALPDVSLYGDGKLFTLLPANQVYQLQNGIWVRLI